MNARTRVRPMKYAIRVGERRKLFRAVATRTTHYPNADVVTEGPASAVPFPRTRFAVEAVQYLDYRPPADLEGPDPGAFLSYGAVRGTRQLGPNATWKQIRRESVRVNNLSLRWFKPGGTHVFFEGGDVVDGVFRAYFGS